ncbi:collagenase-like [Hyposmocoma kahamanoa]|uniref:collagenase-like n=1 Tax=Hyposmocoma kahamanoa TaxID=1477025 RepID=UPI000E6D8BC1|nr:collagenase-like [Hyposmocoma kahamanoa]
MKLLILLSLICISHSIPTYEPVFRNYHEDIGVKEAARIKAAEEAMAFNGGRIVGGSLASLGEHPYLGGLQVTLVDGRLSVCGSSLISNTRLVTAAHCWKHGSIQAFQFTVVLGSLTLFTGGTRVVTSDVEMHADYQESTLNNDVAIIVVPWIDYNDNIKNINLATGSNAFVDVMATATGFGRSVDNGPVPQNLQQVDLPVINNTVCANVFGPLVILESTLCASTANGRSTCGGDSGGPLSVYNNETSEHLLIGVSSFVAGSGCLSGFPAGFARVSSFVNWIQARM